MANLERTLSNEQVAKYRKDGFLAIENFLTDEDVSRLKQACWRIVEDMDPSKEIKTVFSTNNVEHPFSNTKEDFLTSGDKVRFFFEEKAMDENRELIYRKDGFLAIENFLTDEDVSRLKQACWRIVEDMDPSKEIKTVFSTNNVEHPFSNTKEDYFLTSGDKVRFFFEEKAMDENRELITNKHQALNKIGHALHWFVPEFKELTFSNRIKQLLTDLGYLCPAVVQSMYIFKPPGIGGEVTPHQDCTFLSTEPQSCMGLWFALEDATLQNSCLWFSPGSQACPTKRRFIRNPDPKGPLTIFTAPIDEDDPSLYVPVEVKKGTLVLINGEADHKSEANTSENSRHIYTFHVIERKDVTWDPKNWLQETEKLPFVKFSDVTV